ncbi:helix-turn-helix transcriptional regulator [Streptomyces griseorubiginosus]|uniref:helix-turn-helix transcriptional regulator n=1 Tax=Streptomyces griseorubiginosus TaxID=67304 RepID=UPI002E822A77|nr:helix-turn-helix transcriptional regulator [Streptomyces griseorubiginosus]WUB46358.1 helix-turn-helix domain-containing protein [Streptomyces griseorubiginosus]WUB54879.1 helix-turn-helix domain-containing protein [Streptomyces griseorubiginosus]
MAAKRVRLAQRRKSAGYSQEKLAERLGVERSTVVRWEKADSEPQPWVRPKLAAALNVTLDELQSLLDDVTVIQVKPSERMSYVLEHPSSVDLVAVAYLHERIRQLDERYDRAPSTALLGPAGQVHGQVKFLRENATNPRVRKALFEVEAESATFMGQLVWDVSQRRDHDAPVAYLDEAVTAARQVRDPYAEAYATLRKSFVALYGEKNPLKGATLAGQAAEVARSASPSLTGLSLLHVAEGYAMSGDLTSCEGALTKAETQLARVGADDVAAEYYTINEFSRLSGSCYLFLNLPERAEPILRMTARALAAKQKSQAIVLGNLTLSLIRQRKLDEAAATMHRTIDAVELTRGGGGLNLAFAAGRELREWRHEPWVQDVNDRLLALMAAI